MGLRVALKDKGRVVTRLDSGTKVRGRTTLVPYEGPWFKCRVRLPKGPEAPDGPSERRVARKSPSMMVDRRDGEGDTIDLKAKDRLEIITKSNDFGTALWEVVSTPSPIRKKVKVIGWQIDLRLVDELERE